MKKKHFKRNLSNENVTAKKWKTNISNEIYQMKLILSKNKKHRFQTRLIKQKIYYLKIRNKRLIRIKINEKQYKLKTNTHVLNIIDEIKKNDTCWKWQTNMFRRNVSNK